MRFRRSDVLRLLNGESGKKLVQWLNELDETKEILENYFDGRPINEQNLTEWKQGGHQEWLKNQETCERVERLADRARDLNLAASGALISDGLSSILAAELADAIQKLDEITDPNERWLRLKELLWELSSLRNADHRNQRLQIDQQRWDRQKHREDEEEQRRDQTAEKYRIVDMLMDERTIPARANLYGGGEFGQKMAEYVHCLKYDLPMPKWDKNTPAVVESQSENQTSQSGLVKPDQA